ncbi:MAG: hypothetical protein K2L89_00095, partial [Muribaculaceae bacterium]|nr:hypothetical protein [Muribaculaceae bacterium]
MKRYAIILILFLSWALNSLVKAEEIVQEFSFHLDEITQKVYTRDNTCFSEVVWEGLEKETDDREYCLPVYFQTVEIPENAIDIKIKIKDIEFGKSLKLAYPLGRIYAFTSPEKTKLNEEGHYDNLSKDYTAQPKDEDCVRIFSEYSLNSGKHYVTVKIRPVLYVNDLSVKPINKLIYSIDFNENPNTRQYTAKNSNSNFNVNKIILGNNVDPSTRRDY